MSWLTLLTILYAISSTQCSNVEELQGKFDELQAKYTMILDEVQDLRKNMKTMRDDAKRMKKISRALDVLCQELHSVEEKSNLAGGDEDALTSPISIVALKTQSKRFEVEYQSATKATLDDRRWYPSNSNRSTEVSNVFSEGTGLVEGTARSTKSVSLTVDDYTSYLTFSVTNNTEITLPTIQMVADVQHEVVFDPGQSVEINLKSSKEPKGYEFDFYYGMYTPLRNESSTVFNTKNEFQGIISRKSVKNRLKYSEQTFVFNRNKEDYEGVVEFELNAEPRATSSVRKLRLVLALNVRRSDHINPFPEGFLGFLNKEEPYLSGWCRMVCMLYASIIGNDPEDVTLWRLIDGQRQQTTLQKKKLLSKDKVEVYFLFRNFSKEDEGQYLYQGTSYSGTVIEKEVTMTLI